MALSFDDKIFFHISRTGGNYARKIIRDTARSTPIEIGHQHYAPMDIYPEAKDAESFCIVRHPLEWYRSNYRFYSHTKWRSNNKTSASKSDINTICRADTFEKYIQNVLGYYKYGFVTAFFSRFIPFVDHILYTKNLTNELQNLLNSWGYRQKIDGMKTNKSRKEIPVELSSETREKLFQRENGIIKYLNL